MTDDPITAGEALALLQDVFAAPIVVALVPERWWGRPEATLSLRFEAVEDEGWANLSRELDTGAGKSWTGQWIELVPRGCPVSRDRFRAFALGLRDAMPAIFVRLGCTPESEDPSRRYLVEVLRDLALVTREDFAGAMERGG